MKTTCLTICLCCRFIFCIAQDNQPIAIRDSARLFGEGTISTGDFSFNTTFTPDNRTVYFSRATPNFGYIAIFYAVKQGLGWSKPRPVKFSGIYRDTDPVVAPDGKRLYFSSDRPWKGRPFTDYDYHLFYVELSGKKVISDPVPLELPSDIKALYPSFAANGNLYFFMTEKGDADIYRSRYQDGKYLTPEKLPFNTDQYFDFDPVVASDESFIIFASSNRKGVGSGDLWISFSTGDKWTEPVNMGKKINTTGNDGAPALSRDNQTLYFSSFREKISRPVYKGKINEKAVMDVFHSTKNGLRKIYQISIADIQNSNK